MASSPTDEEAIALAWGLSIIAAVAAPIAAAIGLFLQWCWIRRKSGKAQPEEDAEMEPGHMSGSSLPLAASLGFAAGVMLYVSLADVLSHASEQIGLEYCTEVTAATTTAVGHGGVEHLPPTDCDTDDHKKAEAEKYGGLWAKLSFFGGILLMYLLHNFVHFLSTPHAWRKRVPKHDVVWLAEPPTCHCPPECTCQCAAHAGRSDASYEDTANSVALDSTSSTATMIDVEEASVEAESKHHAHFRRLSLGLLAAISLHNLPEGLATFSGALASKQIGYAITFGLVVHNMPEGLALAFPVYQWTGSYLKAVGVAALSGLAELLGSLIAYAILSSLDNVATGVMLGVVSGVMTFIAVKEILTQTDALTSPVARRIVPHATFVGMFVAWLGGLLFTL